MLSALTVVLVPVAIGTLLGLWPAFGRRGAGPASTFAISAAATIALTELLPSSANAVGAWTLPLFLAALVAPAILERFAKGSSHTLTATLGLAGMVAHQMLEGAEVGILWEGPSGPQVALGVGAHAVPLVAVVLQPFASRRRMALTIGAGLLLATALGVVAGQLGASVLPQAEGWLTAVVAGLLMHVLWHVIDTPAPHSSGARTAELAAMIAGIALPLAFWSLRADTDHGHGHGAATLLPVLLDLTLETGPMLLLGLVVGALLQTLGPRIPPSWLHSGSRFGHALRGALVGAPLPLCACSILPISEGLRQQRASAALVVAFLLATPELGIETVALSFRFLGVPLSALRLAGAVVAALVAAIVVARNVPTEDPGRARLPRATPHHNPWRAVLHALDELVYHIGPWVAVGLITAALIQVLVTPAHTTTLAATGLDLPLVSLLAIPSYVCATSATPLAGVLWAKGLSAGAVLAGLLLGPATNVATLAFLTRAYGRKAMVRGLVAFVAVVWTFAILANVFLSTPPVLAAGEGAEHTAGWLTWVACAVMAGLALRNLWQVGPRAWVSSLSDVGGHDHSHGGHDHSHGGHDHGHGGHGHGGQTTAMEDTTTATETPHHGPPQQTARPRRPQEGDVRAAAQL